MSSPPGSVADRAAEPLPTGFRIVIDVDTKQLDESTLRGGSPERVLRLSGTGRRAWERLREAPVRSTADGILARRLTDAGLAHPRPPARRVGAADVTVVIPVRDRAALLEGCLAALGRSFPVLVVDDGSRDADEVAAVAARHGASVVRRAANGGPAPARNTGLAQVDTEFVALLDSDCVASAHWIETLAAHFADPCLGAIAPRIIPHEPAAPPFVAADSTAPLAAADDRAAPPDAALGPVAPDAALGTVAAATARRHRGGSIPASLDMGRREARVVPMSRLSYVPSAALLVRRAALLDVARGQDVFDPALRYGEDVDLIWRLHHAGWRVRYDPSVQVGHQEPASWRELLARRFRYGTSAAPLSRRHPGALAPMVLLPWPTLTVAALLARRPLLASGALAGALLTSARSLRAAGLPPTAAVRATAGAVHRTWVGVGRCAAQFASPALLVAFVAPGRRGGAVRWGRRLAVVSLLLGPPLKSWAERRREPPSTCADPRAPHNNLVSAAGVNPVSYVLGQLADEVAYGAGVYAGCLRGRTTAPLRPRILWRPPGGQGSARLGAALRACAGHFPIHPADFAPRMWAETAARWRNWPQSRCKVGTVGATAPAGCEVATLGATAPSELVGSAQRG